MTLKIIPSNRAISDAAYEDVKWRAGSQKRVLLRMYLQNPEGLSDTEACELAGYNDGLSHNRCVELRKRKLIRKIGTKLGSRGSTVGVYVITEKGAALARKHLMEEEA